MKIPCVNRLAFVVSGLSFLKPALTVIQYNNLTLIATALILGARFNLTEISHMWLKEKCVSTLSYFLSDAKFSTTEMQDLYLLRVRYLYKITDGYFIIDDTMKHHTNFCKWIHGVCILFDHALKTNLKAICIVVLYYSDGALIKFPMSLRIYYQSEEKSILPWRNRKKIICKKKYDLAIEMIESAIDKKFPRCTVLADSWFGVGPFVKELKRLKLSYVLEIKTKNNVRTPCQKPKLTPKGKLAKNQYDLINMAKFFENILSFTKYGFSHDEKSKKLKKVLYQVKITTVQLNSFPGKHRIIESFDPTKKTTKYLLTNELNWEANKILFVYSHRWVIEEFFRNAKQLTDMEGATVRSEQGVTTTLCLILWIDFLLHFENYKQSIVEKSSKEPLTIPSIVRQAKHENLKAFMEKVQNDKEFLARWLELEQKRIYRTRKVNKILINIDESELIDEKLAA